MADVIVDQESVVELEKSACVIARLRVHEQLAGHAEMDAEGAPSEFENNEFSVAPYRMNRLLADVLSDFAEILSNDQMRKELCAPYLASNQSGS